MSMIGSFKRLRDADLQRLLRDPSEISAFLYPDVDEGQNQSGSAPSVELDVDKAWHGIHFLLTGSAWEGEFPWCFIVSGGATIGDEDVGYGPARGFDSQQVAEIAAALAKTELASLRARFDAVAMTKAEIYPGIWDDADDLEGTIDYVLTHYEALREFLADAAQSGDALIVYLS